LRRQSLSTLAMAAGLEAMRMVRPRRVAYFIGSIRKSKRRLPRVTFHYARIGWRAHMRVDGLALSSCDPSFSLLASRKPKPLEHERARAVPRLNCECTSRFYHPIFRNGHNACSKHRF
jgi:hypothetical protein